MHSVKKQVISQPPCAVQKLGDSILIGTYDLQKSGERTGALERYSLDLDLIQSTPLPSAVLDVQIAEECVYTAQSTGEIRIFDLQLTQTNQFQATKGLVTQLQVSDQICATTTEGELAVFDKQTHEEIYRHKNHSLEAWTVLKDENLVYTGGDDAKLVCTDLRLGMPIWQCKPHDAGVVSILKRGSKLWTGGYDDCINEFDPGTRRVLDRQNLGGGVWRLVPNNEYVLACCMYGGLRILNGNKIEVLGSLENHESMVYGGCFIGPTSGITCSFYDKLLQRWDLKQGDTI